MFYHNISSKISALSCRVKSSTKYHGGEFASSERYGNLSYQTRFSSPKSRGQSAIGLLSLILLLSMGCATSEFQAIPSNDVKITADGKMATVSQDGIAISVRRAQTPNRMGNRITTFRVALINQTDHARDFVPKEFLLFDQHGRQFYALPIVALGEAVEFRRMGTFITPGFGYHSFHHPWWFHGPTYYIGPTYQGMVADALPTGPIRIFSRSIVEGNLYFNVSPRELKSIRVQITRLEYIPKDRSDHPKEYEYIFPFRVIQE